MSRIVRHPNYNGNAAGFPNDIAMLYLSSSANTNSQYIGTIALPNRNENFAGNSNCYITGWGATQGGGSLPNILQVTPLDITLRPRRNEQHFADDISKRIFFNENVWISIKISLKFVPKGPINNIPALVQIMAWRRSGDKPLSEPMMVSLPTHICVTRPQWVIYDISRVRRDCLEKMSYNDANFVVTNGTGIVIMTTTVATNGEKIVS